MTFRSLAKALLRRQLRAGLQPKSVLRSTPEAFFVEAYTRCAACQQSIFRDSAEEVAAIRAAETSEQFVQTCTELLQAHDCPAKSAPRN